MTQGQLHAGRSLVSETGYVSHRKDMNIGP